MKTHPEVFVPMPRSVEESESILRNPKIEQAAREVAENHLVVWDNDTVYALVGNANNPNLQEDIQKAKGDRRGERQPVGWTVPFDRALDLIDVDRIEDPDVRELAGDSDKMSRLIAGIGFIRAHANLARKRERGIADAIIPAGVPEPMVQIYSPTGNDPTSKLVRLAIAAGAEPVMTSANESAVQDEIIYEADARAFTASRQRPLTLVINKQEHLKRQRPRGSYPVLFLAKDGIEIVRPGCFSPEIIERLFAGYPVRLSETAQTPRYPDNVLSMDDIRRDHEFKELTTLQNEEFKIGLHAFLGWHRERWDILLNDRPA